MKKLETLILSFLLTLLFLTAKVYGQTQIANTVNAFHFDIGVEGGLPTYHLNMASTAYTGATALLQYGLSKNLALTLTSGYYYFKGNSSRASLGMVPVKLGARAFIGPGFYFSGEIGAGFETKDPYAYKNGGYGLPKSTRLILSPGFGYAKNSWDFGVRYENFSGKQDDYGLVGLRVAYSFGL
jgi:hypothetical protein